MEEIRNFLGRNVSWKALLIRKINQNDDEKNYLLPQTATDVFAPSIFYWKRERGREWNLPARSPIYSDRVSYRKRHSDRYYRQYLTAGPGELSSNCRLSKLHDSCIDIERYTLHVSIIEKFIRCRADWQWDTHRQLAKRPNHQFAWECKPALQCWLPFVYGEKMVCPRALFHRRIPTSLRKLNPIYPDTPRSTSVNSRVNIDRDCFSFCKSNFFSSLLSD